MFKKMRNCVGMAHYGTSWYKFGFFKNLFLFAFRY